MFHAIDRIYHKTPGIRTRLLYINIYVIHIDIETRVTRETYVNLQILCE